ncbi:1,6-anhydro-N-acetylmuramyl-L-alanine amidase AmpD [Thiomicrospira sp. WB1]|uniref:1,6-anhydro-N-acetylmuramyl-L-alanine amidase AmpD n=1 Tax=Thiomicrospira sp. WB1 TaxID=1685380 RepID=UPI00074779FE|nr:1,6-anhydro-N-acetylmuramyl-L-alanine amidase AmpD [Thiomicrospira sp. WB1]KUJ71953.1 N-acetyl-anhydromuranmyl-L-alanine amidase [Thiomicrospira sp. WB1]
MQIDPHSHCLTEALLIPSPNADERPDPDDISMVVIHGISLPPGQFQTEGVTQLFTNTLNPNEHPYYAEIQHLKVSSHLFIRRDGELIQYVPFHRRAWHAGQSQWQGRQACNDFAIGIELEGTDTLPYDPRQYQRLNQVLALLKQTYPRLSDQSVVGHCDIAPGRKTDPGEAFDWSLLKS